MYGIDQVLIDDSLFQFGITERSKYYFNGYSDRFLKDKKKNYSDKEIENDPLLIIYFGLHRNGKYCERHIYHLFEMASYLGGMLEVITITLNILAFVCCICAIDVKTISVFYKTHFD
jgi:hypothetical protein